MRVGSEGVGGTPYDATGAARAGEAKPGAEPAFAVAGFFELLALLQGATAELTPENPDAEGSDEAPDDEIEAAASDGTQGPPAGVGATDQAATLAGVVVTLSSDALTRTGVASTGGTVAAGSTVGEGVRGAAAGSAGVADAMLAVPGGDGQVARAAIGERASIATAVVAEPTVNAASQPPPGSPEREIAAAAKAQEPDPAGIAEAFRDGHTPDAGDEQDVGDRAGRVPRAPGDAPVKGFAAVIERAQDAAPATTTATLDATPPSRDELAAARDTRAADPGTQPAAQTLRASLRGGEGTALPSWIERLTSPQRLALSRKAEALTFDLEPNGLGRIEVRLSFGRDGVRAQVFAEHEHTRTLLANQQPALAAAFERNDLRLESFLVDLGLGADGQQDARSAWDEMNAFDQIGLVSSSTGDDDAGDTVSPATTLLSVRA